MKEIESTRSDMRYLIPKKIRNLAQIKIEKRIKILFLVIPILG